MKMKKKTLTALLLALALVLGCLGGCAAPAANDSVESPAPVPDVSGAPDEGGAASAPDADSKNTGDFDAEVTPPEVLPVIVISGSYHEMGVQYGTQMSDYIARNAMVVYERTRPNWDTWEHLVEAMDAYEKEMTEKTPAAVEMWKGISEGSGVDYNLIRLLNLSLELMIMPPAKDDSAADAKTCSHISAWGDATADGEMIAGLNVDQGWNTGTYSCIVLAYPKDGNAILFVPPWAGIAGFSFGINSAGVTITGSGGMNARPEDSSFGPDNMASKLQILLECSSAEEALNKYLSLETGSAENAQFLDANTSFMVEYTPAVHVVRQAGDNGEKDYLIATNYFIDKAMSEANYPDEWMGGLWDSIPRYKSYEQMISENYGGITVETVMEMLGCTKYWDGTQWQEDTLSLEPFEDPKSLWSPEARSEEYKTLLSCIAVPSQFRIYVNQGGLDSLFSTVPRATGKLCSLVLDKDITNVLSSAGYDAKLQIWLAAGKLSNSESISVQQQTKLDEARDSLWKAYNYSAKAYAAEGDEQLELYGKALSNLCRAQIYAKEIL